MGCHARPRDVGNPLTTAVTRQWRRPPGGGATLSYVHFARADAVLPGLDPQGTW